MHTTMHSLGLLESQRVISKWKEIIIIIFLHGQWEDHCFFQVWPLSINIKMPYIWLQATL